MRKAEVLQEYMLDRRFLPGEVVMLDDDWFKYMAKTGIVKEYKEPKETKEDKQFNLRKTK